MDEATFRKLTSKSGYSIASGLPGRIKSGITRQKIINQAGGEGEMSLLERDSGLKSIRPKDGATPNSRRCVVRVKVFRRRLTDTGNDCWKYHLDALRYIGWLADDNDAAIRLEEEPHEKVETNEEERVEITIEYEGIDLDDLCEYYKDGPRNQP